MKQGKHRKQLAVFVVLALLLLPASPVLAATGTREDISVSAGETHSMAIKSDGSLWGWGANYYGQLGDGSSAYDSQYTPVKILDNVAAVSAGYNHTMAIKSDGSLWAWGYNSSGQLGDGTYQERSAPVKIMDGVSAVSAGDSHTLALKTDGSVWAWGENDRGQIGSGSSTSAYPYYGSYEMSPVKVLDGAVSISAGDDHSLAVKADGSLWAWGYNLYGQLGDGTTTNQYTPVKVMDGVSSVSGGGYFTMIVKTDGTLWGCGYNESNELGDGTSSHRYTPVKIMDGVASVSAGWTHSMAIKTDGTLWAWGSNSEGKLGTGSSSYSFSYQSTPIQVMDNVAAVSAGYGHTLALKSDGTLWGWGDNYSGQLGTGPMGTTDSPVNIISGVKLPGLGGSTGSGSSRRSGTDPQPPSNRRLPESRR